MKVLNLRCAHDHHFEGWFASEDDYQTQLERGLVECPMCADRAIQRMPTAPRLNKGTLRESSVATRSEPGPGAMTPEAKTMQAMWAKAVQHVMANTVDVGDRFAEEARRMHYGETEDRPIRGQATREDTQALVEEGIEVLTLPVPAGLKGPLQ